MHLTKKILSISFLISLLFISSASACSSCYYDYNYDYGYDYDYNYNYNKKSAKSQHYEAIYRDPPRAGLDIYGPYIISTTTARYVNSPSKLKRERHAVMVDASNRMTY